MSFSLLQIMIIQAIHILIIYIPRSRAKRRDIMAVKYGQFYTTLMMTSLIENSTYVIILVSINDKTLAKKYTTSLSSLKLN